jgi:hypothetical protein
MEHGADVDPLGEPLTNTLPPPPAAPPPPPGESAGRDGMPNGLRNGLIACVAIVIAGAVVVVGVGMNNHLTQDKACSRVLKPINSFADTQNAAVGGTKTDGDVAARLPDIERALHHAEYGNGDYNSAVTDAETQVAKYRVDLLQNRDASEASTEVQQMQADFSRVAVDCNFTLK